MLWVDKRIIRVFLLFCPAATSLQLCVSCCSSYSPPPPRPLLLCCCVCVDWKLSVAKCKSDLHLPFNAISHRLIQTPKYWFVFYPNERLEKAILTFYHLSDHSVVGNVFGKGILSPFDGKHRRELLSSRGHYRLIRLALWARTNTDTKARTKRSLYTFSSSLHLPLYIPTFCKLYTMICISVVFRDKHVKPKDVKGLLSLVVLRARAASS